MIQCATDRRRQRNGLQRLRRWQWLRMATASRVNNPATATAIAAAAAMATATAIRQRQMASSDGDGSGYETIDATTRRETIATPPEPMALARFGAACLIASREDPCDLDAVWLQDVAEATGVLCAKNGPNPAALIVVAQMKGSRSRRSACERPIGCGGSRFCWMPASQAATMTPPISSPDPRADPRRAPISTDAASWADGAAAGGCVRDADAGAEPLTDVRWMQRLQMRATHCWITSTSTARSQRAPCGWRETLAAQSACAPHREREQMTDHDLDPDDCRRD